MNLFGSKVTYWIENKEINKIKKLSILYFYFSLFVFFTM